jgi:hypothetical protein
VVFPLLQPFPLKDSSPWVVSNGGRWSPDMLEVSPSVSREIIVSDAFRFELSSPPLVPIPLAPSYGGW